MKVKSEFDQLIDKKNDVRDQFILVDKILKETRQLQDKSRGKGIFWRDLDTYYGCEKRIEQLNGLRDSLSEYYEYISDRIEEIETNK
jgi:hypothetical protein